jgi:hypothetical protein
MLARELGIGKASALLPVTMPTHRAQNLHERKGGKTDSRQGDTA